MGSRLELAKLARGFFSRLNKIFFPLKYASFWQTVYQHAVANKKYTTYICGEKMAILVKGQITITKGFDTWQKMVYEQDGKLEEHGIKFLFAGTERENPEQLHVVMMFPNMEAIQAFRDDDELTEKRKEAGAVIESGVMTPISDDYFTNYPDAYIKN